MRLPHTALAVLLMYFLPRASMAFQLSNPINQESLYCFLSDVLSAFVLIVFPIVVLALVYSGYLFVAAQGNPQKLNEARGWLIGVVIGALIILGAQVLAVAVESTIDNMYVDSGLGGSLVTGRQACD